MIRMVVITINRIIEYLNDNDEFRAGLRFLPPIGYCKLAAQFYILMSGFNGGRLVTKNNKL